MTYTKNVWQSGDTLTAVKMNNIEVGLEAVAQELSNVSAGLTEEEVKALAQEVAQGVAATAVAPKLDTVVYEADKVTFALKSEIPDVSDFVRSSDVYTKGEIDAKLVGAMTYKGAVETEAQLPQDAQVGDMYDVTKTGHNFAWNGESWDDLGGSVDLSGLLTKEEAAATYQVKGDYQPVGDYALKSEVAVKLDTTTYEADKATFALKSEIPNVEGFATKEELTGYQPKGDYQPAGDYALKSEIPDVSGKLDASVYEADKPTFALKSEIPSVEGLVSAEQLNTKLADYATTEVVEAEFASYDKTIKGEIEAGYTTKEQFTETTGALDTRVEALEDVAITTAELPIALKSFTNKVHEKAEILGWFGVEDEAGLKNIIASKRPIFVRYGITLSAQPRYYKFPAEYVAFESNTQVKLVFEGLDTSDDSVVRYTILMNLDGTLIGEQSNISMVLEPLGADVSNLATKEEVAAKADSEHTHKMADITDITKLVNPTFLTYNNPTETVQYLPKLEQSYVDDLLDYSAEQGLVTINGQPWNAETNNWKINSPYVVFGHFNESLTFEANLWEADAEHLGVVFNHIRSMIGTFYTEYQSKVKSIEERLTALESK